MRGLAALLYWATVQWVLVFATQCRVLKKKKKKTEIKGVRKEPGWRTLTLERLRHALSPAVSKGNEASLVDQLVKNLPAMQETQVRSLAQEDPLEEGMTTRSSIIAWRTPWTEELGGLQSMGSQRVGHD